jgi:GTP-binding protein
VIAFDMPGTTRDSIEIPFERGGKQYTLIDTAGIRRRGKVFEAIEKFSVVKTLQSISEANVVVLMLDAQQDISEQDAHIAGFILESGRALVVAVNKWDGLTSDRARRDQDRHRPQARLPVLRQDALHLGAEGHRHRPADEVGRRGLRRRHGQPVDAAPDARAEEAVEKQEPRARASIRPKMRYAHQGGQNPPIIVIHGNALDGVTSRTSVTWKSISATRSTWSARRCGSNCGAVKTRSQKQNKVFFKQERRSSTTRKS